MVSWSDYIKLSCVTYKVKVSGHIWKWHVDKLLAFKGLQKSNGQQPKVQQDEVTEDPVLSVAASTSCS